MAVDECNSSVKLNSSNKQQPYSGKNNLALSLLHKSFSSQFLKTKIEFKVIKNK